MTRERISVTERRSQGVGAPLHVARRSLGSYELVRLLARGGMADVYLARKAGRLVALKILADHRAGGADPRAMFLDEARVVALLDHENIARVFDVETSEDGHYLLAMELVHGVNLRELLAARSQANRPRPCPKGTCSPGGSLAYEAAIAIVMAAAAGLDHAHRRCDTLGRPLRLVHRDVSLSNVMVGHDGVVKVIDFGIASTTIDSVHTAPDVVRGKASYMSPEQCLGDPVDHRSDVFALGVVLYELTTGARCFSGKSDFDRMLAVVRGDHIAPGELVAGFPGELDHVIRCALATDPERRYPSAAALGRALAGVLAARGWTGGVAAIRRTMTELYGDGTTPWEVTARGDSDGCPTVSLGMGRSRLELGLARGSSPELRRGAPAVETVEREVDDDERTRGRRTLKRPPTRSDAFA
jgi:eukaryotic-like serine/threonine-protein kinase